MRTLRQMPKLVGETDEGDPIFEVRSARLVLRGDAGHFNRLVACSRCGREVAGAPVLSAADLDHPAHAVVCKDCVRAATGPDDQSRRPEAAAAPPAPAGDDRLAALERRLAELAEQLGTGAGGAAAAADPTTDARLAALTTRLDELAQGQEELAGAIRAAVARLEALPAGDGETRPVNDGRDAAIDTRIAGLEREVARLQGGIDDAQAAVEQAVAGPSEGPMQRLELMAEVLRRLQADVDKSIESRIASSAESQRVEEQLNDRLDRIAERVARAGEPAARTDDAADRAMKRAEEASAEVARLAPDVAEGRRGLESFQRRLDVVVSELEAMAEASGTDDGAEERLRALEAQVVEAERRLTQAIELQRDELRAGLQADVEQIRSAVTEPGADTSRRLQAMEKRLKASAGEIAELGELHAVLDVGLGTLRSDIVEIRQAVGRIAGEQADVQDRMEALVRVSLVGSTEDAKGRKVSRKGAGGQIAALMAAGDDLAREHQQLRAQVTALEEEVRAAVSAAARASSQASATGPLRTDIRFLQEQLAVQIDAVEAIEQRLRGAGPSAPAPEPVQPVAKPPKPARRAPKG